MVRPGLACRDGETGNRVEPRLTQHGREIGVEARERLADMEVGRVEKDESQDTPAR
jgi:hypothetical protein